MAGKGRILPVAGLAVVVVAGVALWLVMASDADVSASHVDKPIDRLTYQDFLEATGKAKRGGVAALEADPPVRIKKTRDGWMKGDHPEAIALAEEPFDLDELVRKDKERWEELQTWKLSHGGISRYGVARQHCMARELKGRLDEPCHNDVTVVLHRKHESEAEVVFVKPRLSEDASDACRAYSECVAENGWLGRTAPMPAGDEDLVAVKAGDMLVPFEGSAEERRALLETQLDQMRDQLEQWRQDGDPALSQQIALVEDMVEFYEWTLEQTGA